MKKLVLFFAAAVAISFASCCGNKKAQAEECDAIVMEEAMPMDEVIIVEDDYLVDEIYEVDAE